MALSLIILGTAVLLRQWRVLYAVPLVGYGFAWVGHFFFEHNKPATLEYPLYSLRGDWALFVDTLRGRIPW